MCSFEKFNLNWSDKSSSSCDVCDGHISGQRRKFIIHHTSGFYINEGFLNWDRTQTSDVNALFQKKNEMRLIWKAIDNGIALNYESVQRTAINDCKKLALAVLDVIIVFLNPNLSSGGSSSTS
uniref:TTF-type domain-containing protein n=1 Tax=Loa loa TaxID=7209 RepID=A0A1I7VH50_LOALO